MPSCQLDSDFTASGQAAMCMQPHHKMGVPHSWSVSNMLLTQHVSALRHLRSWCVSSVKLEKLAGHGLRGEYSRPCVWQG